jgi:RNA polymerase sigma-70 factor (ECF subfamily)
MMQNAVAEGLPVRMGSAPFIPVTQNTSDPDAELMLRVKEGDESAFAVLVEKYQRPVMNFIYRMVLNVAEAEDLTQDAFLRAYRAAPRYRPEARFSTWLFRIAINLTLKKLHAGRRNRVLSMNQVFGAGSRLTEPAAAAESQPDVQLEQREILQALEAALHGLPERQRIAVMLQRFEGFSYHEISETMGCSIESVESLLGRAKLKLRDSLARYAPAQKAGRSKVEHGVPNC